MVFTADVHGTSFTVLYEGPEADIDIVFVHGFTGHPRDTWTLKNSKRTRQSGEAEESHPSERRSKIPRFLSFGRANSTPSSTVPTAASLPNATSTSEGFLDPTASTKTSDVFWPADLLKTTVPTARILTFGYDTHVRHRFQGPVSKNTVHDHAANFLAGLEARRRSSTEIHRPILFVVHSLGGIVVKDALHQSKLSAHMTHLYSIYERTIGCVFFGTPHRGSGLRDAFRHIIKLGEVLGWKPNKQIVDTLVPNSEGLASLRDVFPVMCHERKWQVHSFQEEYGLALLSTKVVDDTSSYLNDPIIESREHIASNHMDMCRFYGLDVPGYHQVAAAITRIICGTKQPSRPSLFDRQGHHPPLSLRFSQPSLRTQNMEDDQADQMTAQDTGGQHSSTFPSRGPPNSRASQGSIKETLREELVQKLYFDRIDERLTGLPAAYGKTCRWFLDKSEYTSWLGAEHLVEHGGFLWIKGNPGTGKSTLMKFLFEKAKHNARDDPSHIHLSFFFNARGDTDEKSTIGLYRSLLHQLFEHTPDLVGSLEWMTLDGARGIQRSGWHEEALKQTLKHATKALGTRSLTIFVDALDECDQTQAMGMVEAFEELCELAQTWEANLRICFSSRHYPTITIQTGLELVLEHEAGHEEDIRTYIKSKLRLGKTIQAEALRAEILEKSSGIFLWIVLVMEILNREFPQGSITQFRARLKEIPPKLHELFEMIIKRDEDNLDQLRICFNLILFAKRPLTPQELYFAVQIGLDKKAATFWDKDDVSLDQMKNYVRASSKGLAEVTQVTRNKASRVQFIHESVRDFLLGKHGSQWSEAPENTEGCGHKRLRDCCLAQLQASAPQLPPYLPKASESAELRDDFNLKFPFLEYSVQHVLQHSDEAQRLGSDQSSFVSNFPLAAWVALSNIIEKFDARRYTETVSMLYALAEKDASYLITAHPDCAQLCFKFENERYGTPLIAAVATGSANAARAMYSSIREHASRQPTVSFIQTCILNKCKDIEIMKGESPFMLLPRDFSLGRNSNKYLSRLIAADNWVLLAHCLLPPIMHHFSKQDLMKGVLFWAVQAGDLDLTLSVLSTDGHHRLDLLDTLCSRATHGSCNESPDSIAGEAVEVNIKDSAGRTPFWYAVEQNKKTIASLLLQRGARVYGRSSSDKETFWLALRNSDEMVIQLLLENGSIWIEETGDRGHTPLSWAAEKGHAATVQLLLQSGADMTATNATSDPRLDNPQPPLSFAAQAGHKVVVQQLLEKGADIEIRDKYGRTPLSVAAARGCVVAVRILLEKGADVKTRDQHGQTPLSVAAETGHEAVIHQLLKKGAEIETIENGGRTPLSIAAAKGHEAAVKKLLEKGAKIETMDKDGRTPLMWAARHSSEILCRVLIWNGAKTDARDFKGCSPLSWAARGGNDSIIQVLLGDGADVESRDAAGRTALSWAAGEGFDHTRPIQLLIGKGANIEAMDAAGRTALSWAATNENSSNANIKVLLTNGANAATRDLGDKSPLDWAKKYRNFDRIRLLEEALGKSGRAPGQC